MSKTTGRRAAQEVSSLDLTLAASGAMLAERLTAWRTFLEDKEGKIVARIESTADTGEQDFGFGDDRVEWDPGSRSNTAATASPDVPADARTSSPFSWAGEADVDDVDYSGGGAAARGGG